MSAVVGFFDAFGYHKASFGGSDKGFVKSMNATNALGYIPVLGSVIGVVRIKATVDSMRESSDSRPVDIGSIVRGILETLCLGLVVGLLVDLPVTVVRLCSGRNANQNSLLVEELY